MMLDLEGRTFGPGRLEVTPHRVASYVDATGDDPERWIEAAPPGFASAALFVVAPGLLSLLTGRSVVHGEQTFAWDQPISVGEALDVRGTVTRVRERGGVVYVGFDIDVNGVSGRVVSGASLFLLSGDSAPVASEVSAGEPAHDDDGAPSPGQRSASRAVLVKYAAATGDWNPVHWDHEAAVAAGFPGVVVHGLLQAGWAIQAATQGRTGARPAASARVRFRAPLRPARPVTVSSTVDGASVVVDVADSESEYLTARIELADA